MTIANNVGNNTAKLIPIHKTLDPSDDSIVNATSEAAAEQKIPAKMDRRGSIARERAQALIHAATGKKRRPTTWSPGVELSRQSVKHQSSAAPAATMPVSHGGDFLWDPRFLFFVDASNGASYGLHSQ